MKITSYDIEEIKSDSYSDELKCLVTKILTKDPDLRLSALEILNEPILKTKKT